MNLKMCRKKLGFTQNDAANYLGIPKSTYIKWEMEQSAPSGDLLNMIVDQMQSLLAAGASDLYTNGYLKENITVSDVLKYADRIGYKKGVYTDYMTDENLICKSDITIAQLKNDNNIDKIWIAHFRSGGDK